MATALRPGADAGCLCHGLIGNADILVHLGREQAEPGIEKGIGIAHAVARLAGAGPGRKQAFDTHEQYAVKRVALLSGLAGVGLFLLRLRDRRIPSILYLDAGHIGARLGPRRESAS